MLFFLNPNKLYLKRSKAWLQPIDGNVEKLW